MQQREKKQSYIASYSDIRWNSNVIARFGVYIGVTKKNGSSQLVKGGKQNFIGFR